MNQCRHNYEAVGNQGRHECAKCGHSIYNDPQSELAEARAEIERLHKIRIQLEKALNPFTWTKTMSDAWHSTLPDTQAAFNALHIAAVEPLSVTNKDKTQ